jgi:hypothetical protein
MKKLGFIIGVLFCLTQIGCVTTRKLVNYKERDDNRQSVVEQYYAAEKTKRPNSKYVFPFWKSEYKDWSQMAESYNDLSYYVLIPLFYILKVYPIPADIISTIFISPFTSKRKPAQYNVIVSGELVDEKDMPIKNYKIYIDDNSVSTDDNGFFSKQIKFDGSKKDITVTFLQHISELQSNFNMGEKVTVVNPISIIYRLTDNGKIEVQENTIELKQADSQSNSRDAIEINKSASNNLNSNKIVLTKLELQSDRNRKVIIEEQEAEEKRKKEKAIRKAQKREKQRMESEKEEKKISAIINKIKQGGKFFDYSTHDMEIALNRVGMLYDQDAYIALMNVDKDRCVSFPVKIFQVIHNKGFLVYHPNIDIMIYVDFNNTDSYYDDQWIRVKGKIAGTYRYVTVRNVERTIPKVYGYLVSLENVF